jgi:Beta-lactamase
MSITETFTSAVVLQLIEQGQLSFDDTLDQWLPDYPNADGVTVRMLLTHTSGMADYANDPGSPCCVLTFFADPAHANFEPYGLDDTTIDDGTATITQHGWFAIAGSGSADLGTFDPSIPRDADTLDLPRKPTAPVLGHHRSGPGTASIFVHDLPTGISLSSRSNVHEVSLLARDELVHDVLAVVSG